MLFYFVCNMLDKMLVLDDKVNKYLLKRLLCFDLVLF